jgi:hypothetical protein
MLYLPISDGVVLAGRRPAQLNILHDFFTVEGLIFL